MAMVNSMCMSYGRRKALIRQRQNYFQNKIICCKNEIVEYKKQAPLSIHLKELECMITNFIKQEQHRLCITLKQQRQMLKFDAEDHRFVEMLYQLNPSETEVCFSKFDYFKMKLCIYHGISLFILLDFFG